jgi:molecular chaperone IbpA
MTSNNTLTLRAVDVSNLHKFAVGFDTVFDEILRTTSQQTTNYPPYNVVKHSDVNFAIELAVAGFRDGEIDVSVERNQLTAKGEKAVELNSTTEYLYRGISSRSFTRTWTLAEHIEVVGAKSENGILTISLELRVPESQKPKSIAINYNK